MPNVYVIAAFHALLVGRPHHTMNETEIEQIAKKALEAGNAMQALAPLPTGDDAFPAETTQAAPPVATSPAP